MSKLSHSSDLIAEVNTRVEKPSDAHSIEKLHAVAFGPGRFARAAFRLREANAPRYDLSWLAYLEDDLVGAVRMTDIHIGDDKVVLLGPLCTEPKFKSKGIGRLLMAIAMDAAREAGVPAVLLVGDFDYYAPFGFERVSDNQIVLPGPAEPHRILLADLGTGSGKAFSGPCR